MTFGDTEIEKNRFYHNKIPILLKDADIDKLSVSNKISMVKKVNTLLVTCIMVIKLNRYI